MDLKTAIDINADAAAGTTSYGSDLVGRKYWVVSNNRYGNSPAAKYPTVQDGAVFSGPYDTPEEAERASAAAPYTKVVSRPQLEHTPAVRDIVRQRMVKTNPDVDAKGTKKKKRRKR